MPLHLQSLIFSHPDVPELAFPVQQLRGLVQSLVRRSTRSVFVDPSICCVPLGIEASHIPFGGSHPSEDLHRNHFEHEARRENSQQFGLADKASQKS